ncbi:MAG: NAD-dependent deacylase [Anaerolineae bacterium]|nr:NAD-dependent deacylase [Anaerolineae bacterium]
MNDAGIRHAARLIRNSRYAVALTGAGLSTPSGIPDFRSPTSGLWQNVNAFEVASLFGFKRHPEAFFNWIKPLAQTVLAAAPNPAHIALAQLERAGYLKSIVTQNIDMLHGKAGSQTVYEVHGHFRQATCIECFAEYDAEPFIAAFLNGGDIPRCTACGGVLKPDVILFGEQLPARELVASQQAARRCDLMLIAGSSLLVAPAGDLPLVARQHGARLIVVNYEKTHVDDVAEVVIHENVAQVLPQIAATVMEDG